MILWTIQRPAAWQQLQSTGVLRATAAHAMPDCEPAYAWMIDQMAQRIGPPPEPGGYPIWAWHWYYGKRRPKPDLRCGGHLGKGEPGVRIEFEAKTDEVLLSDFEAWHAPLNNCYRAASSEDAEAYRAELAARGLDIGNRDSDPEIVARVRKSWERIFDLDHHVAEWTRPPDERYVQACLWEVRLDRVRDVTPFVSR